MTEYGILVLQLVVAFICFRALLGKLGRFHSFVTGVRQYEILPAFMVRTAAVFIIAVEGFLAITHATGVFMPQAALAGVALFSTFLFAVGVNLIRARDIPCHCEGAPEERLSVFTGIRLLLIVGAECWIGSAVWAGGATAPTLAYRSMGELFMILIGAACVLEGLSWAAHGAGVRTVTRSAVKVLRPSSASFFRRWRSANANE